MSNFLKGIIKSSFGILTSRVFGLLRDISIAAFYGANALTDAFFVAYAIPNLFRAFFAEGALSSAFVPFLSDNMKDDKRSANQYLTSMFIFLALITSGIVLLFIMFPKPVIMLFMPGYADDAELIATAAGMLRFVMPYLLFISLCGLFTGFLYLHNSYYVPYSSTALLNISMIAGAYLGFRFGGDIYWLCYGVIAGGAIQLMYILFFAFLNGYRPSLSGIHPDVPKTFRKILPSIAGLGITQLYFTLGRIIASFLDEGSISYLYYADRIFQLPLGMFAIAVGSVTLTEISRANTDGDAIRRGDLIDKGVMAIFLIIIPAALGLILVGAPVVEVVYARREFDNADLYGTAQALVMFCIGMLFFSYTSLFSKVFFSEKDMKTPVKGALAGLIVYIIANALFIKPFGHAGIALASACSAITNTCFLYVRLRDYRFDFGRNAGTLIRIVLSAAIMCAVLLVSDKSGLHVLITIPLCVIVYFVALRGAGIRIRTLLR
ncbi:murein biosynthesis integral membrane protein MurJ [Limisalsivibrio acetivorans]|uniref:murein biosynthesis integral membrane protein MurJ n=1 Tax=Limisalsivibrio acetivorans TaxID=1304888 RepID=UPI0003B50168|nr:murein biosynthesis integral membrane protein MurJ [Limisalsivibrio acetivorans]